jgi:hypothetical protein
MPLMLELKYEYFPNTWQGRIKLGELVRTNQRHLVRKLFLFFAGPSLPCFLHLFYLFPAISPFLTHCHSRASSLSQLRHGLAEVLVRKSTKIVKAFIPLAGYIRYPQ